MVKPCLQSAFYNDRQILVFEEIERGKPEYSEFCNGIIKWQKVDFS